MLRTLSTLARRWAAPAVPSRLRRRWRSLDADRREFLGATLTARGYRVDGPSVTASLADHLVGRLTVFRREVVPWLADAVPLDGATVLEIGCGTGSSTVALAEQGAQVIGVDILPDRVDVARTRCAAYDLRCELHVANAVDVSSIVDGRDVDLVVFFAALEHMTLDERLAAMRGTWAMLRPGGHWCLVDTPNRLWVFDGHTSVLPFFHWLPDELAVAYMRHSPRAELAGAWSEVTPESVEELARHGRGISYHEFEVAIGPLAGLDVVSDLAGYRERHSAARRLLRTWRPAHRVERVLRRAGPPVHPGFYTESLDLVLRKP
ncbi:MAG: hypothetical protein QOE59_871 [Actinomycetota bacterium]|nr:hypothetical protein [Actinomycetota bacterium]